MTCFIAILALLQWSGTEPEYLHGLPAYTAKSKNYMTWKKKKNKKNKVLLKFNQFPYTVIQKKKNYIEELVLISTLILEREKVFYSRQQKSEQSEARNIPFTWNNRPLKMLVWNRLYLNPTHCSKYAASYVKIKGKHCKISKPYHLIIYCSLLPTGKNKFQK